MIAGLQYIAQLKSLARSYGVAHHRTREQLGPIGRIGSNRICDADIGHIRANDIFGLEHCAGVKRVPGDQYFRGDRHSGDCGVGRSVRGPNNSTEADRAQCHQYKKCQSKCHFILRSPLGDS